MQLGKGSLKKFRASNRIRTHDLRKYWCDPLPTEHTLGEYYYFYVDMNSILTVVISFVAAGQERFKTITSSYYRGAHGVMIVYDIARKETFTNLNKWLNEVETYANQGVLMILVGNKTDLDSHRQVSTESGAEWAALNDMPFIETSAKDSVNVTEAFTTLAELVNKHVKDTHTEQRAFVLGDSLERGIRTGDGNEKEKCGCSN